MSKKRDQLRWRRFVIFVIKSHCYKVLGREKENVYMCAIAQQKNSVRFVAWNQKEVSLRQSHKKVTRKFRQMKLGEIAGCCIANTFNDTHVFAPSSRIRSRVRDQPFVWSWFHGYGIYHRIWTFARRCDGWWCFLLDEYIVIVLLEI